MLPPALFPMNLFRLALAATLIALPANPALGQDPFDDPFALAALEQTEDALSQSDLLIDSKTIAPGVPFTVTLKLTHPDGWHSYYHNDGVGISKIPTFTWTLPEGFTAGELLWPTPHQAEFVELTTYGYLGTNYFSTIITPPADLEIGDKVTLQVQASWQTCKESCIDEKTEGSFTLPVTAEPEADDEVRAALAAYNKDHLPVATPTAWSVRASDEGGKITLRVTTGQELPAELYFYDYDGQIDPQAKQEFTTPEPGVWELTISRNKGNYISDDHGPVLPVLKGILAAHDPLPGDGRPAAWITVGFDGADGVASAPGDAAKASADAPDSLLKILGLAFLGGLILNLMPCVFPVLGLKVMGFVQQAGEDPASIKKHGLVFAAGLLVSLWILAGILIALIVLGGQYLGWGFQLNDPRFLAVMIMIFFVMGLNLSGVFEFGTSMSGVGGGLAHKKGYSGSFFSGVLTTLVATPCTGPFLGVAMTFALQQPLHISFLVFTALGLGIASPYLLLSFSPKLLNKLPRPGAWMETFKQALAFPLYLAVVYFLNGFGGQTGRSGMSWLLTAMVVVGIALWIYGHWCTPGRTNLARRLGAVTAIMMACLGIYTTVHAINRTSELEGARGTHLGSFESTPWAPGIVAELQGKGHMVFMDYTSDT